MSAYIYFRIHQHYPTKQKIIKILKIYFSRAHVCVHVHLCTNILLSVQKKTKEQFGNKNTCKQGKIRTTHAEKDKKKRRRRNSRSHFKQTEQIENKFGINEKNTSLTCWIKLMGKWSFRSCWIEHVGEEKRRREESISEKMKK